MAVRLRCIFAVVALFAAAQVAAAPPEQAEALTEHLEFLGYTVSRSDEQLTARHGRHADVVLKRYAGGILVSAYYVANDYGRRNRDELVRLANEFNREAVAARYYVDGDGDLVIEAYYPGNYRKDSFGLFLENYNLMMGQLSAKYDVLKRLTE
jgi:hypothetical protein